jgi:hypothetical protein
MVHSYPTPEPLWLDEDDDNPLRCNKPESLPLEIPPVEPFELVSLRSIRFRPLADPDNHMQPDLSHEE